MADKTRDFRISFGNAEGPDWIQDLQDEDEAVNTPQPPALADEEDEFERLRQRSARTASSYGEVQVGAESRGRRSKGLSLNQFTPGQRLILAILVFLNVIVIIVAILAIAGIL